MFIVWGTKVVRRKLGRVAHLCPLCREVRSFRLTSIETVGHLYYIPLGRRTVHGVAKRCETCGVGIEAQEEDADSALFVGREDLDSLIAAASPRAVDAWARRRAVDARIGTKSLTAAERGYLIREPFLLLEPRLNDRSGAIHFDAVSGLLLLATFMIPLALALAAGNASKSLGEGLAMLAIGSGVLLLVATVVALATDGRRFCRRKILPTLIRALRPLGPAREELEQELGDLKTRGLKVGKKIRIQELWEGLQTALD